MATPYLANLASQFSRGLYHSGANAAMERYQRMLAREQAAREAIKTQLLPLDYQLKQRQLGVEESDAATRAGTLKDKPHQRAHEFTMGELRGMQQRERDDAALGRLNRQEAITIAGEKRAPGLAGAKAGAAASAKDRVTRTAAIQQAIGELTEGGMPLEEATRLVEQRYGQKARPQKKSLSQKPESRVMMEHGLKMEEITHRAKLANPREAARAEKKFPGITTPKTVTPAVDMASKAAAIYEEMVKGGAAPDPDVWTPEQDEEFLKRMGQ
ncbi:hypothetical protein [Bacteriophage sp.]|nr:hypothetical protein [Bacteriophage sp.]UOF80126.1 hypothetical protein [Bacteriophage sp.]